ncbi:MAG: hypothetical protein ACYDC3_05920 [Candidatus Binataceae bacterium]
MATEEKERLDGVGGGDSSGRGYERSKIVFPYGDLDDALSVAKAIYKNSGTQADFDQLADWMKHGSVSSGTFRVKVAAARIFGLATVDNNRVTLLRLGQDTQDPDAEQRAKALAFLNVPLYRKIFETYRGRPLPDDKALEKVLESFGVAIKQTNRARQTFQRAAEQAKVFNDKKDRLVLPAGVSLDSTTPNGGVGRKMENQNQQFAPSSDTSPVLSFLLKSLPPSGSEWSRDARQQWMRMLELALDEMYKPSDE